MSTTRSKQPASPELATERFPSLASLRVAHTDLLKRHREQENDPAVLAQIERFIEKGCATGAVLDSEDDRWTAQGLLDYWSSVLYRAGRVEPSDIALREFDPDSAPDLDDELCPYLGLEAFQAENEHLFFGRQRLLDKLLKHLENHRFLMVVGSSGSGKSSVVLGGVLPKLVAGALPGSRDWTYYAPLVPGSDPLAALVRRLRPTQGTDANWTAQQVKALQLDPFHLSKLVASDEPKNQQVAQPVVLFIDQFEEVFTLCREDAVQEAFVQNLINFVQAKHSQNRLILTMRTDFESQLVRMPDLLKLFEASHIRTTALEATELREAIVQPAALVGLKFEEGLIDELLSDVLGEPTALPLLQFTLLKLWDHRERNRVTWEAYRRLGGGRLALAKSADEFYDSLIPEEQVTMKRILLRMVRPGEGLEVTSRRIPQSELYRTGEAEDRINRVLDKLVDARLVRLSEGETLNDWQVEVAHEALIRNWPQLVNWLEDARATLRQRLRLTATAEQWKNLGKDASALLRGLLLEEALTYEDLSDLEADFVKKSVETQKLKRDRLVGIVSISFLVLLTTSVFSIITAIQARQQKANAEKRLLEVELLQKADEVESFLSTSPEDGLLLAIQITGQSQNELGRVPIPIQESLSKATEVALFSQSEAKSAGGAISAFSPDGDTIATGSDDGVVLLWNRQGRQTAQIPQMHDDIITSITFSPDGRTLATASADNTLKLWDPTTGETIVSEALTVSTITSAVFSPDGKTLATAGTDRTLRLWDIETGTQIGEPLIGHTGAVTSVAFSPDGKTLLTGSTDYTIQLRDASTGTPLMVLVGHTDRVTSVAFSPDGQSIASASEDGTVKLWDTTGELLSTLKGHDGWVTDVAFSPDATQIATSSLDGTIRVWTNTGKLLTTIRSSGGSITSVQFSPDGEMIVASSRDGATRSWDTEGNLVGEIMQSKNWQTSLDFACNSLRESLSLNNSKNSVAEEAKSTCQKYVWGQPAPKPS